MFAGLSARSFGRFAYYVTQIAAGRVERGLPTALRRCGYRTFSLYPARGAFMSAKSFQTTTGVQTFVDQDVLRHRPHRARPLLLRRRAADDRARARQGPMFMFVYLAANHYPWTYRWRPDLAPEWKDLGNAPQVDEYLRRQTMGFRDYAGLVARLKRDFPGESFLLVRYGDHQPDFASPSSSRRSTRSGQSAPDDATIRATSPPITRSTRSTSNRSICRPRSHHRGAVSAADRAGGRRPAARSLVRRAEADPRALQGLFYGCNGGAEARRFNRLLIDAGLIKGL